MTNNPTKFDRNMLGGFKGVVSTKCDGQTQAQAQTDTKTPVFLQGTINIQKIKIL